MNIKKMTLYILYLFVSHNLIAPSKKKTENGGKGVKRQLKKKSKSSDSDTDEIYSSKQNPVRKTIFVLIFLRILFA